jgi:hypothetical protein
MRMFFIVQGCKTHCMHKRVAQREKSQTQVLMADGDPLLKKDSPHKHTRCHIVLRQQYQRS